MANIGRAVLARSPARLRPSMACRLLMQTRAAWPVKPVTWGGGDGVLPAVHDDNKTRAGAGWLQWLGRAQSGPAAGWSIEDTTNDWLARAKSDRPISTSLGGSTAVRPANGGPQRLQRANVGA